MKKIKKIVLSAGAIGAIIAPVTAVIACGDDKTDFDFTTDLEKVEATLTSSKLKATLKTDIGAKEAEAVVTAAELGITDAELSEGVSVTYAVKTKYTDAGVVVVTATLAKGGETSTKEITITSKAPFSFTADLAKFTSVPSGKIKADLKAEVGEIEVGAKVTAEELGYTLPAEVTSGVEAAYTVKVKYDDTDAGVIVLNVVLTKGDESSTETAKDITITAKTPFDFAADLDKISNTESTKNSKGLRDDLGEKAVGDTVTAAELGITTDTTITSQLVTKYTVKTILNLTAKQIILNASLMDAEEESTVKVIAITAKENTFDFADDLAKIIPAESRKDKATLNTDIGSKGIGDAVTAAELGITTDATITAEIATTYAVKTTYNETAGTIAIIATLTKGEEIAIKEIIIRYKAQ